MIMYGPEEATLILQISRQELDDLLHAGRITGYITPEGKVRIPRSSLVAYCARNGFTPPALTEDEAVAEDAATTL